MSQQNDDETNCGRVATCTQKRVCIHTLSTKPHKDVPTLVLRLAIPGEISQHNDCWCPGPLCKQFISIYCIDHVRLMCSCCWYHFPGALLVHQKTDVFCLNCVVNNVWGFPEREKGPNVIINGVYRTSNLKIYRLLHTFQYRNNWVSLAHQWLYVRKIYYLWRLLSLGSLMRSLCSLLISLVFGTISSCYSEALSLMWDGPGLVLYWTGSEWSWCVYWDSIILIILTCVWFFTLAKRRERCERWLTIISSSSWRFKLFQNIRTLGFKQQIAYCECTLLFKSYGIYFSNTYLTFRSSIFWSKPLTWHLSGVLVGGCEISNAYDYSSCLYNHSKSVRFEKHDIKTLTVGTGFGGNFIICERLL